MLLVVKLFKQIFLSNPDEISLNLGEDIIIKYGESIQLDAQLNTEIDTFIWTIGDSLSCYNCLSPEMKPLNSTWVKLYIRNSSGCFSNGFIYRFMLKRINQSILLMLLHQMMMEIMTSLPFILVLKLHR